MVSKKIIADLIIAQKSGGFATPQSKIDERDVFALCDIAVGSLIDAEYRANIAKGNYTISNAWVSTFENVQVYWSNSRKEKYITVPARPIELPGDRAIRNVCPQEDQTYMFIIVDDNSRAIFSELEAGDLNGMPTCYLENDKIFFQNLPDAITKVMVKAICGTEGLDEELPIPIPAISQKLLYDQVSAMLETQVRYKTKVVNDSNANTV